ncbi:hypothetical protein TRFO_16148 [Tritrichomonas foetus]|uniref:Uncharacterized protein n=1 Tax=Tritrichomonas foetus TaxID=1144522 RepID=A0A1J4KVE3_9EUKA|nr:hypothetical protein TRFO_16148 [Tritrichomonas foetus]|eukprot:OHT13700.1 hypothetical protein TRFO_16148 [Tritrichomonas foetus]
MVEVQPLVTNSDESDNPEVQLTTSNQTESIIMPLSDTDMTLASHIDVFQDICSNESLLSMDSALSSSQLAAEDLGSISKTYEMSEFASELTTSAQLFRQKWKESLKKNPQ